MDVEKHYCHRLGDHDGHEWKTPYGGPYWCTGHETHEGARRGPDVIVSLDPYGLAGMA